MDAISDDAVSEVVVMSSAQVGKTEIINNACGYYIDQDPSTILLLQPTLEMGQAWSKDRLAPMLRDTPCLKGKVKEARSRDSGNTMLHKQFPGGHLTIAGANSPASLASRPIRVVMCDEVDRYPASAGAEGDPINLAKKRSTTFHNRKLIVTSTPTVKGISRIEAAYMASDQRKYHVPCPHCGEYQTLKWGGTDAPYGVKWPEGEPWKAFYVCEHCGAIINDADKLNILKCGEWRPSAESSGVAGFHLNEIYSPWVTFGEMAASFLEAKKLPETLKTWINTALGETWEEQGETVDDHILLERREQYPAEVPEDALVLTAGVDVQDDRLEIEVVGWGLDAESWSISYDVLYGDPGGLALWSQLDALLMRDYSQDNGSFKRIAAACIDSGGHHTQQVYAFCATRYGRRVFAIKGVGGQGRPLISRPTRNNARKVRLFSIGTDTAKDMVYSRLRLTREGPGYCHFPAHYDTDYFDQLTSEKAIVKHVGGKPARAWVKKSSGRRNEALDCRVYAVAAFELLNPNLVRLARQPAQQPSDAKSASTPRRQQQWINRRTGGNSWLNRR